MNLEQVIELVEKWIADPKSVSKEELRAVHAVAFDAVHADAVHAAAALYGNIDDAKVWVAEYHNFDEWWQEFTLLVEYKMSICLDVYEQNKFYKYFEQGLNPAKAVQAHYLGACNN